MCPGIGVGISPCLTRSISTLIPPPPYAVFSADGINTLTYISGLDYVESLGPSAESALFDLYWDGLSPAAGNITITPSNGNVEIFNPSNSIWYSVAFNIGYLAATSSLAGFKVRMKSGLAVANYSTMFTVTAPNTSPFVLSCSGAVAINNAFVITVKTDNAGSSAANQFTLPLLTGQTYNAVINWGDGNSTNQTTDVSPTHAYSVSGTYQVSISGTFPAIYFNNGGDRLKLLSIDNWGDIVWGTMTGAFYGCANMTGTYTDYPDTSNVTDMFAMFAGCSLFNSAVNFDTSNVTTMFSMFFNCTLFNQAVAFDTSSVTTMYQIFYGCPAFNQAVVFDTSSVTNMGSMFYGCTIFNQVVAFNTSSVTIMANMFRGCAAFNQSVAFNTAIVTDMSSMFRDCIAFNQPVPFNTVSVTSMLEMFYGCTIFNSAVNFTTTSVTTMNTMFAYCSAFNQPVPFNTSTVTDMFAMFFVNTAFNQALSFNTTNVTNMKFMLYACTAFNQNIGAWVVSSVLDFTDFMFGKTAADYSTANLDAIYNTTTGWASRTVQPSLSINFGSIKYTAAGSAGKAILVGAPNLWTITDGGI